MRYLKKFPASLFELKDIRSLAAVAMLLALRIVLGMFANATLPMFGNTVKFSAAFIPIAVAGAMFGPIPAGLVGALGDVLSFLIAPTGGAYFPGFTISGLLTGLIYGFALYNEKLSLPRIAIAWAVNALVVESFMAAYFRSRATCSISPRAESVWRSNAHPRFSYYSPSASPSRLCRATS